MGSSAARPPNSRSLFRFRPRRRRSSPFSSSPPASFLLVVTETDPTESFASVQRECQRLGSFFSNRAVRLFRPLPSFLLIVTESDSKEELSMERQTPGFSSFSSAARRVAFLCVPSPPLCGSDRATQWRSRQLQRARFLCSFSSAPSPSPAPPPAAFLLVVPEQLNGELASVFAKHSVLLNVFKRVVAFFVPSPPSPAFLLIVTETDSMEELSLNVKRQA